MISATRNTLCMILVWLMAMAPALPAQQTGTPAAPAPTPINTPAPIPEQIRSAHRIFVSNGGGSNYFNIYTDGPDRAYNSFYAELQQENRYQLVGSPSQADLIIEIRAIAPADGEYRGAVDYNPQLILSIQDPQDACGAVDDECERARGWAAGQPRPEIRCIGGRAGGPAGPGDGTDADQDAAEGDERKYADSEGRQGIYCGGACGGSRDDGLWNLPGDASAVVAAAAATGYAVADPARLIRWWRCGTSEGRGNQARETVVTS